MEDFDNDDRGWGNVESIELDLINNKIYWTNAADSKIQRANLDGSHIEDLITTSDGLIHPVTLALDIEREKMYWSDFTADRIQRSNLDGSNIENLITRNVDRVYAIALDIPQTHAIRPIQLSPTSIENQTFMAGTEVSLNMPIAHGGTPTYTYVLEPVLPSGLNFDPTTRLLSGTPETETPPTTFTYTTIDASNQSVSFSFTLVIEPAEQVEPNLDVNGDGEISVLDLVWVAMFYGRRGDNLSADVNQDKVVNVQDFIAVAEVVDEENLIEAEIWEAIADIINIEDVAGSPSLSNIYENVIQAFADTNSDLLYQLLSILSQNEMILERTVLLPNYPNPFNPETWIPYQLANGSEVSISIYSIDGKIIRDLDLGYQPAGIFQTRDRAAYWDGRNEVGEPVASGVYFYTLTAGDFEATRKMLIRK
ncbi:MAG: putative Ig domain-containing protein [Candidatus Poribacteria bacterium]|nr:putative Ig domain-containing protein [Candidatus Poribacteria bacterium]